METTCPVVSPPKNRPAYIVRTMLRWWIIGVEFNSHTMDRSIRFDFYGWCCPEHGLNNNVLLCAINNNKHQPLLGVTGARCCCPQWVRVRVNKRDNYGREPRGNCNINKVREIELISLYQYEHIFIHTYNRVRWFSYCKILGRISVVICKKPHWFPSGLCGISWSCIIIDKFNVFVVLRTIISNS